MSFDPLRAVRPLKSVPPKYRRRGYRHTMSWVFFGVFFGVILGEGPFVLRQLGGTAFQSLLFNVARGVVLLPAILWVPLVERRNPVRLTGLVLALAGLVAVLSAFATGAMSLSLVLTGSLMLAAMHRPVLGTALEQIYPAPWRGKLISLPTTLDMLARGVVLLVAGRLLTRDLSAYRWVFPCAGLCMVIAGLLFRQIHGSRGGAQDAVSAAGRTLWHQAAAAVGRALRNRTLLVFLIGYFLVASGGVLMGNVLPLFAHDELMLTPGQWGDAVGTYLFVMLVSFWFWGRFMDRFGAPPTMLICWSGYGLLGASLFFVDSWPAFLAVVAARGLFMSGNVVAFFPIVMHFTDSSETMSGMGLHSSLWGLRWVLMPLAVIWIVDGALFPQRYVFLVSVAMIAAGVTVMTTVWLRDRRRRGA
ncbi:MAG: MFS transporter [Candidatus Brocadiia bacterium]